VLALVRAVGAVLCVGMGSSDTSAAVEEVEGVTTACLRASWGRMGSTHSAEGTGSEWGVSLHVDGISDMVGDVEEHGDNNVVVCDIAVDRVGSGCSAGDRRMGWGVWVVWEMVQVIIGGGGSGRSRPLKRRRVLTNAAVQHLVIWFPQLYRIPVSRLNL